MYLKTYLNYWKKFSTSMRWVVAYIYIINEQIEV